ncbi:hypothetical protein L914_08208, partial [Phytophthora nicotianae]
NTLNASSSKWLPRATKMMIRFYGRSLGLRTLCETRWVSMQGCFASLLRVQSALQMFYRARVISRQHCVFFVKLLIAPLSLASYRLQRDENTVGDVVRSFADIHRGFQQHFVQYVAVAKDLPETDVSGIGTLTKIAVYYHRRQLATADLGELRRDMISRMRGEFTNIKATEFRAPWEYWDA